MENILVIGSLNMDFVIGVRKRPQGGETVIGESFSLVPGGKGANQAYAIGRMGGKVSLIGAVGEDDFAAALLTNLQTAGVNTDAVKHVAGMETGKAFITVEQSGQNSIIVMAGANLSLQAAWLQEHESLFDGADAVVMQLEIPVAAVCAAAAIARQKGKLVVLDPAPAQQDLPDELLSQVDILKPNETELAILSGMPADTEENIVAAAQSLIARGVNTVIVTMGKRGSVLVQRDRWKPFPACPVTAVDTTAAGDCFTAAFIRMFHDGNYEEAIAFASKAAAIAVTRQGAQSSLPSMEEVIGGTV